MPSAQKRDDFLNQLTLCCLIKSGKPIAEPEHFQDASACQKTLASGRHPWEVTFGCA